MLFSSKIKTANKVTLDTALRPLSFPGLLPLIKPSGFKEKVSNGSGKINWSALCEQMILHAVLNLLANKQVQIEFVELENQFLFNVLKFKNSSFKISIAINTCKEAKIPDHLTNELYCCVYLLANRSHDKKVSLNRVIGLLCKRNSDFNEDTNPSKTFVTSVIDKYDNLEWIKLTNKRKYWILNCKHKAIDPLVQSKLAVELETFSNLLDRSKEPHVVTLIETVKRLSRKHL